MLLQLLQGTVDCLGSTLHWIIGLLPQSPFNGLSAMALESEWYGYLCYLVPLPQILATLEAWGAAVGVFYLYSVLLRWIKAIE